MTESRFGCIWVDVDASLPVGAGAQPPGAGGRFFDGLLDDVRIVQRAMKAGELASIDVPIEVSGYLID